MKYAGALIITALLASATLAGPARAADVHETVLVQTQQDLLGQYALAALAKNKASTSAAKALASDVATNANKANAWLVTYAKQHGITLPNKPGIVEDEQYGELQGASGSSFDKLFGQDLTVDTQLRVDDLKTLANTSGPLASFAKKQLSAMQRFKSQAKKIAH